MIDALILCKRRTSKHMIQEFCNLFEEFDEAKSVIISLNSISLLKERLIKGQIIARAILFLAGIKRPTFSSA